MATRVSRDISHLISDWNKKHKSTGKWVEQKLRSNRYTNFLILGAIKRRLWVYGVSGDGKKLPPYSPFYIKLRKIMGKRTSPTSLNLSGDWYKSLMIDYGRANKKHILEVRPKVSANNEPEKTTDLKRRYGVGILTLNEVEQEALAKELTKEYVELFNTDLKMEIK